MNRHLYAENEATRGLSSYKNVPDTPFRAKRIVMLARQRPGSVSQTVSRPRTNPRAFMAYVVPRKLGTPVKTLYRREKGVSRHRPGRDRALGAKCGTLFSAHDGQEPQIRVGRRAFAILPQKCRSSQLWRYFHDGSCPVRHWNHRSRHRSCAPHPRRSQWGWIVTT